MTSRSLIAFTLMLFGWTLVAEAQLAPAFDYLPNADLDGGAQQDFIRGEPAEPAPSRNREWPQDQYDPRPVEGDAQELMLPMPCGGAMVFRRIEVGGNRGLLGEQQIVLGSGGHGDAPVDHQRPAYISGTFSDDGSDPGGGRHYYLGKYEVTELQYRVVAEACPPHLDGRRPAVKVSWYDAVEFTRRYTEWLYQNAPDELPQEDGVRGYLRLPTEVEWEYAARGGLAVDYAEFQQAVIPTGQESIDDYAWFRESVASSFEPHPVGALLPNPLGLYDVLGNASELVFDLFRLNTQGRLHAQPGGFLVKGGHFRTSRHALRSSWRQEHPHFSPATGMANRLDTVGFRVAISVPVLTSEQRIQAIREEWRRSLQEPLSRAALDPCRDLAAEVRTSLSAMQASLDRCLEDPERVATPVFPSPPLPLAEPPAERPVWSQVWDSPPTMDADEIRHHGLWFLQANDPDAALALFKKAVERGDGWSALAIGAMYDPLVSETEQGGSGRKRIDKPNVDGALCWYRVAQTLGEGRAAVRIEMLEAHGMGGTIDAVSKVTPAPADCERITRGFGMP